MSHTSHSKLGVGVSTSSDGVTISGPVGNENSLSISGMLSIMCELPMGQKLENCAKKFYIDYFIYSCEVDSNTLVILQRGKLNCREVNVRGRIQAQEF